MKKYLLALFVVLLMIVSACSSAATPTSEVNTEKPQLTPTPEVNAEQPQLTPTPEVNTEHPQPTQASASPALKYYPLDTRTGLLTIDLVLDAISSGDRQKLINLFGYISTGCKTVNGLGGPPACRAGEAEGTMVEVLPFLGPEGSFLRKDEATSFPGLSVLGIHAIYQVSDTAYSEADYPAGEYGIMLIGADNKQWNILQVKDGRIIRIDYIFDARSFNEILKRDASSLVLEPLS